MQTQGTIKRRAGRPVRGARKREMGTVNAGGYMPGSIIGLTKAPLYDMTTMTSRASTTTVQMTEKTNNTRDTALHPFSAHFRLAEG